MIKRMHSRWRCKPRNCFLSSPIFLRLPTCTLCVAIFRLAAVLDGPTLAESAIDLYHRMNSFGVETNVFCFKVLKAF